MLQDKASDLIGTKRKRLVERLLDEIGQSGFDLYYSSASNVAARLIQYAQKEASLNAEETALIKGMSQKEIEFLLSYKD